MENTDKQEFAPSGTPPGNDKWAPVSLHSAGLNLAGGFLGKKKLLPLTTKVFEVEEKDATFVLLSKNEPWLLRAACGHGTPRGGLTRSRAIETLRQKAAAAKPVLEKEEPVPSPVEGGDYDPMAELDDIEENNIRDTKKPRKGPYKKKKPQTVQSVQMPVLPLGHCQGQTVTVQVATVGVSIYIHEDAVPWFVAYVADENAHGGIADQDDDTGESAVAEGNSSVPGLRIQWDFQGEADGWEGTFVSGPLHGTIIKSKVSALTEAKWNTAISHGAVSGSLDSATLCAKRKAVWLCIELHGQQLLQEITASDK